MKPLTTRQISAARNAKILEMVSADASIEEISAAVGQSRRAVSNHIYRLKAKGARVPRSVWRDEETAIAALMIAEGKSLSAIARRLGRSKTAVRRNMADLRPAAKNSNPRASDFDARKQASDDFLSALKAAGGDRVRSEYVIKRGVPSRISAVPSASYVGSAALLCAGN